MRPVRLLVFALGGVVAAFVACSDDSSSSANGPAADADGGATASGDAAGGADAPSGGDGASSDDGALGGDAGADAAPGYDARSLAGLAVWLDSEKGVTLSGASPTWEDQSGNGNHAVRSSSCGLPDRNAASLNGHAALGFHEYECFEIADAPSLQWGTGDFMVAAVAQNNFNKPTGDGGTTFTYPDGKYVRKRYGEVYSKIASLFGPGPTIVYNDWSDRSWKIVASVDSTEMLRRPYDDPAHLLVLRRKGSLLELRVDGAVADSLSDAGAPIDVSAVGTKVAIGGRPNLTNFVGSIWEIVAVKGAVADGDLAAFESYAKTKYGL